MCSRSSSISGSHVTASCEECCESRAYDARSLFERRADPHAERIDLTRCATEHIVQPPGKICPLRSHIGRAVCFWRRHPPVAGFWNVEPGQNRTRELTSGFQ
ncbi:protein of unknown function [Burkholderia multivorans]